MRSRHRTIQGTHPSNQRNSYRSRQPDGSALALLVVLLPVLLAVCAYAINLVYMELARTELQITTDVATRAAGRVLSVSGSQSEATSAAERMLRQNSFVNRQLTWRDLNIVFGASTRLAENQRYQFRADHQPNAVSVQAGGKLQVPMLFPTMGLPVDFRPVKSAISTQTELDIAIVLDRSGSMAFAENEVAGNYPPAAAPWGWQFGWPVPARSRWLSAVSAVSSFLDYLNSTSHNEQVALVTYSDKIATDCELSSSYLLFNLALKKYSLKFDGGATDIGNGVLQGITVLSNQKNARPWASRIMIVLTDGQWTHGIDPAVAARAAAAQNILIYTVTFSNEANQAVMQQVAEIGKGQHYHATTGSELQEAFKRIAQSLPTLLTD